MSDEVFYIDESLPPRKVLNQVNNELKGIVARIGINVDFIDSEFVFENNFTQIAGNINLFMAALERLVDAVDTYLSATIT